MYTDRFESAETALQKGDILSISEDKIKVFRSEQQLFFKEISFFREKTSAIGLKSYIENEKGRLSTHDIAGIILSVTGLKAEKINRKETEDGYDDYILT